ncbi:hypothetical protein ACCO45_010346 [Purpureocillium lilacinum]|uniref:Uncharacterized protein n=1 Tax=Purpureocillium lilacinum TaxID=33203 RepID=A0ACC4DFE3_PURLI
MHASGNLPSVVVGLRLAGLSTAQPSASQRGRSWPVATLTGSRLSGGWVGRPGVGRESRRRGVGGGGLSRKAAAFASALVTLFTHTSVRHDGKDVGPPAPQPFRGSAAERRAMRRSRMCRTRPTARGDGPLRRLPMAARLSRRPAPTIRPGSRVRQQRRLWANCRWAWPGRCVWCGPGNALIVPAGDRRGSDPGPAPGVGGGWRIQCRPNALDCTEFDSDSAPQRATSQRPPARSLPSGRQSVVACRRGRGRAEQKTDADDSRLSCHAWRGARRDTKHPLSRAARECGWIWCLARRQQQRDWERGLLQDEAKRPPQLRAKVASRRGAARGERRRRGRQAST